MSIIPEQAGGTEIATNQVSVGTSATLLAARRVPRGTIQITNLGTVDVFVGGPGVTTSNGHLLAGVKGTTITLPTGSAVYAIVGTGTQSVSIVEVF